MATEPETITLSIDSVLFKTKSSLIKSIEDTLLSELDTLSECYDSKQGVYNFDRDPDMFRHILNAYRNKEVHFPRNICPNLFKKELQFWQIPMNMIAPCCWQYMYETQNNIEDLEKIIEADNDYERKFVRKCKIMPEQTDSSNSKMIGNGVALQKSETKKQPVSKLWLFLEEPGSSRAAMIWCYIYMMIVFGSVFMYIIWLNPTFRVARYLSSGGIDAFRLNATEYQRFKDTFNEKIMMAGFTDPHPALLVMDVFCVLFFVGELTLCLISCPDYKNFITDGYNLIKILVTVSMVISFSLEFVKEVLYENRRVAHLMLVCRCINVLRLLLVFKFRKVYNDLHILLLAIRHSTKEMLLLLFSFLIAVIMYGSMMFSAEIETDMFPTTLISLWWALVTMTTIGYGDYYPVSTPGYFVGTLAAISGIVVLAMPIAAIAGTFSNLFARNTEYQQHMLAIKKQSKSNIEDQKK